MPRKKEPPPSALSSRWSTRGATRSIPVVEGSDLKPLTMPPVGLGVIQENYATVSMPPTSLPMDEGRIEACKVNKESSTIPSSATDASSESLTGDTGWFPPKSLEMQKNMMEKSNDLSSGSKATPDSVGTSPAGKSWSAGILCSAGKSGSDSTGTSVVKSGLRYALNGLDSNGSDGIVGVDAAGKPGFTPAPMAVFSPSFKAMIVGLSSPVTTGSPYAATRVLGSPLGEPDLNHGPLFDVTDVGSDGMAQNPPKLDEFFSSGGVLDGLHADVQDSETQVMGAGLHGDQGNHPMQPLHECVGLEKMDA
ncbi:hypothetical protein L1987_74272 [Smallanthus sonchifolius]|uniref:Uncharacterized protein n=1 Tax=Smallanthus sonchifolius TaxID=185202 RepID=A0ACB9A6N0_9ASTR|nr:hypothetical protein L1987_74272 [Smallanthus sonchifolius]